MIQDGCRLSQLKHDRSSYFSEDTIVAVCSAIGGAIAVLRLSGSESVQLISRLTQGWRPSEADARKMVLQKLYDPTTQAQLDEALIVYFPEGASYTGEPVIEVHTHGGPYLVTRVIEVMTSLGARQALPGEFSFRAVKNGKLNLTQAEAVADLIAASNDQALGLALDKLSGLQHHQMTALAEELKNLTARSALGIDFSDQDVPELSLVELKKASVKIFDQLGVIENTHRRGKNIQEGCKVVFFGMPNVGKSSLFNALLGEERSIVTQIAGTTRDLIHETLTLRNQEGVSVSLRLEDTAGLRKAHDEVEQIGMSRSMEAARRSDFVFLICDATEPQKQREIESYWEDSGRPFQKTIGLLNKSDMVAGDAQQKMITDLKKWTGVMEWHPVSARTHVGLEQLIETICRRCQELASRRPGEILITRLDHLQAVRAAREDLMRANQAPEEDLFAADIRHALASLEPIIGKVATDDILRKIFSEFCIGK